jgi:hypothetical protein
VRWQPENGANLGLERRAAKARAMGEAKGPSCHFRRPFFGSFFGRTKKEQIKTKKVSALLLGKQKE